MEHQGQQDRGRNLLGEHQQSDKEPNGGDFKKNYNQMSIKDRGTNNQVFQCTGVVMEVSWGIAIVRWIVWGSCFETAIACELLPSKWPTDLSDHQSAAKHMLLASIKSLMPIGFHHFTCCSLASSPMLPKALPPLSISCLISYHCLWFSPAILFLSDILVAKFRKEWLYKGLWAFVDRP
jgi:hypothetical protein